MKIKIATNITSVLMAIMVILVSASYTNVEKVNANEYIKTSSKQTVRKAKSKNIAGHTIFSNNQINKRLKVIKNYYYNKPKQLKIRKRKISGFASSKGICKMEYYVHGKDLMFGYGTEGKTEYRLYFYKNQLIQMLVDTPKKPRKTYKQLYKRLGNNGYSSYDDKINMYMLHEGYARREMDFINSKTKKNVSQNNIIITKVSGNTIIYHKLNCYGPDGWIWSIGAKAYTANLSKKVSIMDYSISPDNKINRSIRWLRKRISEPYIGLAADLSADGKKIYKIVIPYFA